MVQEASSDGYTRDNGFGLHESAKGIMEQLDEYCVEEVGARCRSTDLLRLTPCSEPSARSSAANARPVAMTHHCVHVHSVLHGGVAVEHAVGLCAAVSAFPN